MSKLALVEIAPVASQLSRLVLLLASDQEGEVVATARAMGRILTGKGLDWFALSQAMSEIKRLSFEPSSDAQRQRTPYKMAAWCRDHGYRKLTYTEREFIRNIAVPLERGGTLTARQSQWLASIYSRLHDGRVS